MGFKSNLIRNPKKEEQLVPDNNQSLEELNGFFGIKNAIQVQGGENVQSSEPQDQMMGNNCEEDDLLDWDFTSSSWDVGEVFSNDFEIHENCNFYDDSNRVKIEEVDNYVGFWGENSNVMEETKTSLNLNLNYDEVLEAWSNRESHSAYNDHNSISNAPYFGEVPSLEDEKTRRETSVLRYKEKRQSRLFSKKIRYQVRKLNADKRPRIKGRFVKRVSDNQMPRGG